MKEDVNSGQNPVLILHQPILFGSLAFGFLSFALPIYGKTLGASALEIGGLFAIFSLVLVLVRPIVGWGLDQIGRKVFFVAALVCFAASMGLFALAGSITGLYIAQFVRGLGGAMMWISAYTIATDLAGSHKRGEAVGHVDEAQARGSLFGGIAAYVLISQLPPEIGWQVVFAGYALVAAVGAWLGWKNVPETRLLHPTQNENESEKAISNQLYKLMAVVFVTATSAAMISPVFLIFLQDRFTTDIGALVLAIIPAALIAGYLPSRFGQLSDRFGRTQLLALGLIGSGIVSFFLPFIPGIILLSLLWALESIGWAIAGPAEGAMIADLTGYQVRGRGYGLYTFAASLGATIGPLIGGWLYDSVGQAVPFYLNGIVLLTGAALVLLLLRPKSFNSVEAA